MTQVIEFLSCCLVAAC